MQTPDLGVQRRSTNSQSMGLESFQLACKTSLRFDLKNQLPHSFIELGCKRSAIMLSSVVIDLDFYMFNLVRESVFRY